jgi:4-carboxymuconolactone decarboxylase
MSILTPVSAETATPDQARIADVLYGARGSAGYSGPYSYFLNDTKLVELANPLGDYLRLGGNALDRRYASLAIAMTVRHWNASYAWSVHSANALKFGLGQPFVDGVRDRKRPVSFADPKDEAAYDYVSHLLAAKAIPQDVERRAVDALGKTGVIDLVAVVGFYTMIGLGCLAFDPQLPPGTPRLPE